MLAESFPATTLPTPEEFLESINAEPSYLLRLLTTSGGTDIYADLTEYVDEQYQDLLKVCGDEQITRYQLSCWLETRTVQIRQKSIELANEQDIRVEFSRVYDSPTSMVFWCAGSMYSLITGRLRQQLEGLNLADPIVWLDGLRQYVDQFVAANEDQISTLERESQAALDSCTAELKDLPERLVSQEGESLVRLVESSFLKRMEVVVLGFSSKIYLDILARSYDFFLNHPDRHPLTQEALLAVENWEVSDA